MVTDSLDVLFHVGDGAGILRRNVYPLGVVRARRPGLTPGVLRMVRVRLCWVLPVLLPRRILRPDIVIDFRISLRLRLSRVGHGGILQVTFNA